MKLQHFIRLRDCDLPPI